LELSEGKRIRADAGRDERRVRKYKNYDENIGCIGKWARKY